MAEEEKKVLRSDGDGSIAERLPQALIQDEIMGMLDLESLCSLAPVCRALRLTVSQALSSITDLDLSGFAPTINVLGRVLSNNNVLQNLTLDCSRLDDYAIDFFAKGNIQELKLLRCLMFSSHIFNAVANNCPKLRLFMFETANIYDSKLAAGWNRAIKHMLDKCLHLEFLSIKLHIDNNGPNDLLFLKLKIPKTVNTLLMQPISDRQAHHLALDMGNSELDSSSLEGVKPSLRSLTRGLRSLSLVLNRVTDSTLLCITSNLPQLVELCLEDRPLDDAPLDNGLFLSNSGLQSLCNLNSLGCLSLAHTRKSSQATFKRVNDVGILLLAEGCKGLESVRLGGFCKVTDAGYAAILHCCKRLKKFELVNASSLTDLAFHDLASASCSLIEVKLISCNLITSEAVTSLSSCRNLQVLDLSGCKSVADFGLNSISVLGKLTTLDLGGADITDTGLSAIGGGSSPIVSLCLRGCKRITDRGIIRMVQGNGYIGKTLSLLDLGYLPGVSDRAIITIAQICVGLTSLCIRNCFFISDASINALGSLEGAGGKKTLRKLDLHNCCGLSADSFRFLFPPFFRGLRWLGIGNTRLLPKGEDRLSALAKEKPGLTVCTSGCEMGCKDGWQYHVYSSMKDP